jgi:hypothetical protein
MLYDRVKEEHERYKSLLKGRMHYWPKGVCLLTRIFSFAVQLQKASTDIQVLKKVDFYLSQGVLMVMGLNFTCVFGTGGHALGTLEEGGKKSDD